MLTKDLLRYDQKGEKIVPFWVSPKDRQLLAAAESLIELFQMSLGQTRAELQESAKHLVNSYGALTFVLRGFEKLLTDRLEFGGSEETDFIQQRKSIFQYSAALIQKGVSDLQQYRQNVAGYFKQTPEQLSQMLYADLPAYQTVLSHRLFSPEQLLHRYNVAQVQGFLLRARQLTVRLPAADVLMLRQCCQYLRFYQLLADIQKCKGHFQIAIDGPLAMFHQSQKYGINLAQLFPALLLLNRWELEAEVHVSQQTKLQLKLDSSCQMQSHYRQFSAFVPDEIERFAKHFAKSVQEWKMTPSENFVPLKGEQYCFPDYHLVHESGKSVSLEFFHAWHAAPLGKRLQQLQEESPPPLILGVAKHLNKKEELGHLLQQSDYFQNYGFFFQKTPTSEQLKKPLNNLLKIHSQQNLF